ncbi:TPA: hypothetical protein SMV42_002724 [Proteus mirabilis]|uniref:hypothetical protein n=1 Tax=Proteus sp. HMSC14B05 TaxID=1581097 RepID=UPI0008A187D5|nr:hypothetical protein [Proteus sp. HMSC14B05]EKU7865119.1 hypothetical protein [Proteus mirabilis]EKU7879338.1 hypothetical protein [Proteus mirabilis]MBI6265566.1 hypothetical protein [Proteus mirabilis]OFV16372.1 hypothetical protein HMPREF3129_12470 [Proteus sp. HMSC14B05]HCZ8716794.1 hypothetical protein [Proteus mirabilis]
MDKSRKQFEGWINKNHPKCSGYHKDIRLEAWQASRESLEVELPVKIPTMDDESFEEGLCEGYNNAIDDFKQILISNGVKIKNE